MDATAYFETPDDDPKLVCWNSVSVLKYFVAFLVVRWLAYLLSLTGSGPNSGVLLL